MLTPQEIAKTNSESAHQKALFAQVALKMLENPAKYACLRWMHAIPNGGDRNMLAAAKQKMEGQKAGVWDIFIPVPIAHYHGMYLELKAPGKIKNLSDKQVEFGAHAQEYDYYTVVADSWEMGWEVIDNYLSLV